MSSENTVDRAEHDALRGLIALWRNEAGLSQRQLSEKLGRPHNFITKIETGMRGVYVVDLIDIIRAVGRRVPEALQAYSRLVAP